MEAIDLKVLEQRPIDLGVHDARPVVWGTSEYVPMVTTDLPEYEGPYEATPTRSTQTFPTSDKAMTRDFTVNPIPSNYGLITWDGSKLTVS